MRAAQDEMDALPSRGEDAGELIEGPYSVNFVILAPGYRAGGIEVMAEPDRLRIRTADFEIERALGCRVDPATAQTSYLNGVLSVRVDKKF